MSHIPERSVKSNRKVRGWVVSAALLALFHPVFLHAQGPGEVPFDTRSDPAFGNATAALREFLRTESAPGRKTQHFCIVGYRRADGDRHAWVYWREGRKIILWRGTSDPAFARSSIAESRSITDLTTDVVATQAEIKGSTYLVTQAWVDHLLSDCHARGIKYQVRLK